MKNIIISIIIGVTVWYLGVAFIAWDIEWFKPSEWLLGDRIIVLFLGGVVIALFSNLAHAVLSFYE